MDRKTMRISNLTRQECIARSDERHQIGTDAEGGRHYFDPVSATLWVVEAGEVSERYATRDLGRWRAFVEDRRGWADCRIDARTDAEFIAESIAEAV